MSERICRWGILSTAGIARKNWKAIWQAANAAVTAVGSRSVASSQRFVDECQREAGFATVPSAHGSYEELLADANVDAVYIPLPTGIRKQWVVRAAEAGKHVLAEKPCGGDAAEVRQMLDACQQNGVQYMDGVMFMHSDRLNHVRAALNEIGSLKRISTHHTFCGPDAFLRENIRLNSSLEPLGAMGDLGWYSIRIILWALDWKLPTRVSSRVLSTFQRDDSPEPVPMEMSAELVFEGGVSANLYCSFITENQQWVNFGGTDGFVLIPDFVLPFRGADIEFDVQKSFYNIVGVDFAMERHRETRRVAEYSDGAANSQETNLFRTFSDIVLNGKLDPRWGEYSLWTQQVMDACMESARQDGAAVAMKS